MKTKIIKITNLSCILCINKLSTVLNSIPNLFCYKINIFTKEIMIKYKRKLPDILKELKSNGFEAQSMEYKPFLIDGIFLALYKISSNCTYVKLFILTVLQYFNCKQKNLKFYRFFSLLSYVMFFLVKDINHLDNSSNILMYIFINNIINEKLKRLGRLNLFKILEKSKFRKIVSNINLKDNIFQFKNIKTKTENNKNSIFYEVKDCVKPKDIIIYKKNDKINVTGVIIKGKCRIDDSSITGESLLKTKNVEDVVTEDMIIKDGQILVEVHKINTYNFDHKSNTRSFYNEFLIIMNVLVGIYSLFYLDNLPEIIEFIIKTNMKICPCIFIISDIILKFRISREIKDKSVIINNFDISKNIKTIFIDKTGTLTRTCKVYKYSIDKEIEGVVYELEKEFDNNYSRGIMKVLISQEYKGNITDKEYLSSCGIRCKFNENEIRIGKYEFCNFLNLKTNKSIKNTIFISKNSQICGYFLIHDYIKKDANNIIRILQSKYKVILLSGDTKRNVQEFCKKIKIKEYFYNLNKEDKAEIIKKSRGGSCMIGDGLNDIPAFLSSTISIGLRGDFNTNINIQNIKDIIFVMNLIRRMNNRKVIFTHMELTEPIEEFKNFLDEYKNTGNVDYYELLLKYNCERIIVNLNDIRNYNTSLSAMIINEPSNIIPQIEDFFAQISRKDLKFGIKGSFGEYKLTPRTLNSLFLGKLICITGIVTSCSICRPKIVKSVHYNNLKSAFVQKEYRDATMITKLPITNTVYPTRDTDGSLLNTEYGLSDYVDYQTFNLQEMPEEAPCGQLPRSVECIVSHDLVDSIKPGDRISCFGIYKSLSAGGVTEFPSKFKNVLIVNNLEQVKKREEKKVNITKFNYDSIAKYIAPSIWGHDKIKKALALMLVGGNEIIMKNGAKIRGDINILLVGDPSTAKSQLLRFIYNFNEISVATTGKGSSGVGLTAAVVIDKDTGDKRLEAGAMVLADRGIVCIDEFDKMNDLDRVAIHEVMEQQTVTISKAGIHTTLNARCSVLAAANPIYGMYREGRKPSENIRLPESIMTRFDLIFVVLDKSDIITDTLISEHVIKSHSLFLNKEEEVEGFKEYIEKCRTFKPKLSKEASKLIIEEYTKFRQIKNKKEQIVSITPRLLETIIRLSTANAKLRFSEITEICDVVCAVEMLQSTLFQQVVKETKRQRGEDEQRYEIDEEIQLIENVNAKKDYVIDLLYEIRVENESLTSISLDDIYSKVNLDLDISKEDVNNILEDLSAQEIIFYENNTVIFIND